MRRDRRARPFDTKLWKQAEDIAAHYSILVEPDRELGFFGTGVEMPGVMADGKSAEECITNLRNAMVLAVATLLELKKAPPSPASGGPRDAQVNVRVSAREKILLQMAATRFGFKGIGDYMRATAIARSTSMT